VGRHRRPRVKCSPVQAEEGQQRYTSRTTPHVTCVTRHAQNAKPTSRCRTVAPWSTTMRRVFHLETNGVKASPHRPKWMLSRGAPAAPSDPWNFDASDVPPRQNGQRELPNTSLASRAGPGWKVHRSPPKNGCHCVPCFGAINSESPKPRFSTTATSGYRLMLRTAA
jgi:hypothetical protein